MKLFIDTCNANFLIALLDGSKILSFSFKEDLIKKADALPSAVENILIEENIKPQDLDGIYVTKGPGSFMGARTGLLYATTLCQVLKIPLYTASSFAVVSQGAAGTYFLDARGGYFFKSVFEDDVETLSLVKDQMPSKINYDFLESKEINFLNLFKEEISLVSIQPIYLKDPRIGGE